MTSQVPSPDRASTRDSQGLAESNLDPLSPSEFRERMPVAERWAYFDHAAVGPLSGPALHALNRFAEQGALDGDMHWPQWSKGLAHTRRSLAAGLNALVSEIAFVANTTDGISLVADAMPWESGDNLVVPAGEFPSNHYAWRELKARGVELRVVPTGPCGEFDPRQIADACNKQTRLIAASWVGFASGFRCDLHGLAEIAHQRGIALLVDAIQGLGVFPLDLASIPIDFLVADGHKWLLSPEGFGAMFIRQSRIAQLRPTRIGWNSVVNPFDYQDLNQPLRSDAQRFEGGSHNLMAAQALGASVELLQRAGWGPSSDRLANQILAITDDLVARLQKLGAQLHSDRRPGHASGIVSFSFPGIDPVAARKALIDRGVVLSCRAGRLRAALHGYNNESDLDRFHQAMTELVRA